MKTLTPALRTHLDGTVTTLASCLRIARADGTVILLTSHDQDITVDAGFGSETYVASYGFTRTNHAAAIGLSVDTIEVKGPLDDAGINRVDILTNGYDDAEFWLFSVNWASPSDGIIKEAHGDVGNARYANHEFILELKSLSGRYKQVVGEVVTPQCRAFYGDGRCKVPVTAATWSAGLETTARGTFDASCTVVEPTTPNGFWYECTTAGTTGGSEPSWNTTLGGSTSDGSVTWRTITPRKISGTVAAVTNEVTIVLNVSTTAADGTFDNGELDFTSGPLSASKPVMVKSWTLATLTVVLNEPIYRIPNVGDSITLTRGCLNTRTACRDDHANTWNYRGEPEVPGMDEYQRIADFVTNGDD